VACAVGERSGSRRRSESRIIDSEIRHLFEDRGLWEEHIDPAMSDEALVRRTRGSGNSRFADGAEVELVTADVQRRENR